MSEKKKNRRNSKKGTIKNAFMMLTFLGVFCAGLIFYLNISKKALFISPLPINYKLNSGSNDNQNKTLLEKSLKDKNIEYSDIKTSNNNLVVNLKDKSKIIFSADKDLPTQIASLQFILTRLTMESKGFKELDLRFDKPVIRQ